MSKNFSAPLKQIIYGLFPSGSVNPYLFINVTLRNFLNAIFSQAVFSCKFKSSTCRVRFHRATHLPNRQIFYAALHDNLNACLIWEERKINANSAAIFSNRFINLN